MQDPLLKKYKQEVESLSNKISFLIETNNSSGSMVVVIHSLFDVIAKLTAMSYLPEEKVDSILEKITSELPMAVKYYREKLKEK